MVGEIVVLSLRAAAPDIVTGRRLFIVWLYWGVSRMTSIFRTVAVVSGFLAAEIATNVATADRAAAGYSTYVICWTQVSGVTECRNLPDNYRLPGVAKPYCNTSNFCRAGAVDFQLTRARIQCLKAYVDTRSMVPGGTATIYAPDKR